MAASAAGGSALMTGHLDWTHEGIVTDLRNVQSLNPVFVSDSTSFKMTFWSQYTVPYDITRRELFRRIALVWTTQHQRELIRGAKERGTHELLQESEKSARTNVVLLQESDEIVFKEGKRFSMPNFVSSETSLKMHFCASYPPAVPRNMPTEQLYNCLKVRFWGLFVLPRVESLQAPANNAQAEQDAAHTLMALIQKSCENTGSKKPSK